jgi:hypothetical protein
MHVTTCCVHNHDDVQCSPEDKVPEYGILYLASGLNLVSGG